MYSELEEIIFVNMSNSDCILVKEEQLEADVNNFNIVKKPTLKIQLDECHVEEEEARIVMYKQVKSTSLEEKLNVEEDGKDDDGFRTPTSLDQRIPVTKQCPLAPRKPRPSLKRKTFNNITHKNLIPLDLSKEVESLFPTQFSTTHLSSNSHYKSNKKARRDDDGDNDKDDGK